MYGRTLAGFLLLGAAESREIKEIHQVNIICKCLGGSHLYGLNCESSDIDERGVFLHSDLNYILGLGRYEHEQNHSEGQDVEYKEYRAALGLIKSGNTQMLELLNNDNWIEISPIWRRTQENKNQLLDSDRIFKCLSGFSMSERRNAFEYSGRIGEKRKKAIEEFGFSPKNVVHFLRLCYTGEVFFNTGVYITRIKERDVYLWEYLMQIKTKPKSFKANDLYNLCETFDSRMKFAFDNRRINYKFDDNVANKLILEAYYPEIYESYYHSVLTKPSKQV